MIKTRVPPQSRREAAPTEPTRESTERIAPSDPRGVSLRSEKITAQHQQRLAIVYVRQSTQQQVLEHRESTARQFALVDRAMALGWPRSAVLVIDEDQGRSGSSAAGRHGFQRLLTVVSSDRVGLILGLEMSRLARSCKDWYALLELCSIYRTLLADADGLYDPSHYNDRLLLGLKGTMSEAELHVLKGRLQQGMWNKAERGAILNHPPIGYIRTLHGEFVIDPDECRVLIRDRFPAYLSWDQFEQNQEKLAENSAISQMLSAPRHGPSVLSGLVICGRCGHRMLVGYGNTTSTSRTLRYSCLRDAVDYGAARCQRLSGQALESFVVDRLLQAVSPASLELSLTAAADVERERQQLDQHWQQRLTRSHYETEQARRQYAAVDPEHRLVARELERRWNESLSAEEQLQSAYIRFQQDCPSRLSPAEREQILSLANDVPALWRADTTTAEDRQAIARLLLEQVIVTVEGTTDRVDVELRWRGGFTSRHTLDRPVQTYRQLSNYEELVARVDRLRAERKTLSEIAAILNAEGFHPPKRSPRFTKGILSGFLRERQAQSGGMSRIVSRDTQLGADEWWLADLAAELSMPIATLHRWKLVGWITARKVTNAGGRWAVYADTDELDRLRRLRHVPHGWPQVYPTELTTPKIRPQPPE